MNDLPVGLYDLLHTKGLHSHLEEKGLLKRAVWSKLSTEDMYYRLGQLLAREIVIFLNKAISQTNSNKVIDCIHEAIQSPNSIKHIIDIVSPIELESLHEIQEKAPIKKQPFRLDIPLAESALLTGSSRTPSLRSQLIKEIASCDSADWLVSFIKYAGIIPLLPALKEFTKTSTSGGGPRLRIATTSYMGATDIKAIRELLKLPNTEVRISYDTKRTRLHAKAYLFHRKTCFSSAYIGSANVSKAALDEGLEWTAKISQYENDHLWQSAIATFESHWEDSNEFTPCNEEDLSTFQQALEQERGQLNGKKKNISFFDLYPYTYQKSILEDIQAERLAGKNKHLIIAATGTGKTMIAAFAYKNYCKQVGSYPRLLFIAHRKEILEQSMNSFRQVLKEGSFGDLVTGSDSSSQSNYLFCTVQSWNSKKFDQYPSEHFEFIVLDEAHHAKAASYQRLIQHIKPKSLIGLTATPERTDFKDIRDDFDGAFTHEIRLAEAIDRSLLCPFHYYGIPDLTSVDFSNLEWKRGGYDKKQLNDMIEHNKERAEWVMAQLDKYTANICNIKALGFCVSVDHAEFMANYCNEKGISAIALTGKSTDEERSTAQTRLKKGQICVIFVIDLYNEGVDITFIDTVLFLRPTESLTLYLQQLGRGLRLNEEKSHLTVLDFIAPQHRNFNFISRFRALSSRPDVRVDDQIKAGMPFVPTGCLVHLEKQAKEHVLKNIKNSISSLRGQKFLNELKYLCSQIQGNISLQQIMDLLHLDSPDVIYKQGLPHVLISKAKKLPIESDLVGLGKDLSKGFRRMLLMDDIHLVKDAKKLLKTGKSDNYLTKELLHSLLWRTKKPGDKSLITVHDYCVSRKGLTKDLLELFDWIVKNKISIPKKQFSYTGPLVLHASYTREQILLALGHGNFDMQKSSREGVLHLKDRKLDVFFADINKSESDFSPTTMYEDYALTENLFHWQSQSTTGDDTPVGQRYIKHESMNYTPLLFIRKRKKINSELTFPYLFAGPLKYRKHSGSKPMSIIWELEHTLPAKSLSWARRIN